MTDSDTTEPVRQTSGGPGSEAPAAGEDRPVPPSAAEPVLRDVADRDLAAIVAIHREAHPDRLTNAALLRHNIAAATPADRRIDLVAEVDGVLCGYAYTHVDRDVDVEGATIAQVMVATEYRTRGVGQALARALTEHWRQIGAKIIVGQISVRDSLIFAMRQRFAPTSLQKVSRLDLSAPIEVPPTPAGITVRKLAELPDPHALYQVHSAVLNDIHNDGRRTLMPYEAWLDKHGDDPLLDRESTVLAFDGDRPVALSWMTRVDDRVGSMLTGTVAEERGKGLSTLVKAESLRLAREAGATAAFASNDDDNAAMLAINGRLGFEPYLDQYTVMRKFDG